MNLERDFEDFVVLLNKHRTSVRKIQNPNNKSFCHSERSEESSTRGTNT